MAAISITPANVELISNTRLTRVQWGETVAAGDAVYLKTSDNKHWLADADVEATAAIAGVAMIGGAADSYGLMANTAGMEIDIGGTVVVGTTYYVGLTAGDIVPIGDLGTGDYVSIVGVGKTSTNLLLYPHATGVTIP